MNILHCDKKDIEENKTPCDKRFLIKKIVKDLKNKKRVKTSREICLQLK